MLYTTSRCCCNHCKSSYNYCFLCHLWFLTSFEDWQECASTKWKWFYTTATIRSVWCSIFTVVTGLLWQPFWFLFNYILLPILHPEFSTAHWNETNNSITIPGSALDISWDQLGIYLLLLHHTHPVPIANDSNTSDVVDSAIIGATVAVDEGQDLVNFEDPVVIKLQSTRIQQKLVCYFIQFELMVEHWFQIQECDCVWVFNSVCYIALQESLKTPLFLLSNEELFESKMCILGFQCTTWVHNLDVGVAGLDT